MSSSTAQEIVLINRPRDHPEPTTSFRLQTIAAPPVSAPPGQLLIRLKVVSVDPYLRNVMKRAPLNAPLTSWSVAEVLDSNRADYRKGDLVTGQLPWRTVQTHDGRDIRKIDTTPKIPLSAYVGVCGMPGRTAYFGLLDHDVGRLQPGQTVVISQSHTAAAALHRLHPLLTCVSLSSIPSFSSVCQVGLLGRLAAWLVSWRS
jgi:NADPH-dependent curcumin reductase CurA